MAKQFVQSARIRRHYRIRQKISGSNLRPRLSIFRSLRHIYVQVIDDSTGQTLASASTISPEITENKPVQGKISRAKLVGNLVAQKALQKGIKKVVFDRGGYQYHGRVRALAEAARESGLEF